VRGERFAAIDRHPQLALEGGSPVVEARGFDDRAAAVSYARRRSELGTPCDVFDAWGELIYTREMDVDQSRAQRGLFAFEAVRS